MYVVCYNLVLTSDGHLVLQALGRKRDVIITKSLKTNFKSLMKNPSDTLITSRYLEWRRVKPLIPEYYIKKSSTHTRTRRDAKLMGEGEDCYPRWISSP